MAGILGYKGRRSTLFTQQLPSVSLSRKPSQTGSHSTHPKKRLVSCPPVSYPRLQGVSAKEKAHRLLQDPRRLTETDLIDALQKLDLWGVNSADIVVVKNAEAALLGRPALCSKVKVFLSFWEDKQARYRDARGLLKGLVVRANDPQTRRPLGVQDLQALMRVKSHLDYVKRASSLDVKAFRMCLDFIKMEMPSLTPELFKPADDMVQFLERRLNSWERATEKCYDPRFEMLAVEGRRNPILESQAVVDYGARKTAVKTATQQAVDSDGRKDDKALREAMEIEIDGLYRGVESGPVKTQLNAAVFANLYETGIEGKKESLTSSTGSSSQESVGSHDVSPADRHKVLKKSFQKHRSPKSTPKSTFFEWIQKSWRREYDLEYKQRKLWSGYAEGRAVSSALRGVGTAVACIPGAGVASLPILGVAAVVGCYADYKQNGLAGVERKAKKPQDSLFNRLRAWLSGVSNAGVSGSMAVSITAEATSHAAAAAAGSAMGLGIVIHGLGIAKACLDISRHSSKINFLTNSLKELEKIKPDREPEFDRAIDSEDYKYLKKLRLMMESVKGYKGMESFINQCIVLENEWVECLEMRQSLRGIGKCDLAEKALAQRETHLKQHILELKEAVFERQGEIKTFLKKDIRLQKWNIASRCLIIAGSSLVLGVIGLGVFAGIGALVSNPFGAAALVGMVGGCALYSYIVSKRVGIRDDVEGRPHWPVRLWNACKGLGSRSGYVRLENKA